MIIDLEKDSFEVEKNGEMIKYEILFTFDCPELDKSYVGYTDHSFASNGRKNIYVSSYNPYDDYAKLEDITDEKEIKMVGEVLQQFYNESRNSK